MISSQDVHVVHIAVGNADKRGDIAVHKTTGVRSDHTVILTSFESTSVYPDAFRRVTYLDVETKKRFKFLTNNFTLPAP